MPGAPTAALLGAALALAGLGFDSPSLVVAGLGMAGLAGIAVAWVELARPRQLIRGPGAGAGDRGRALRVLLSRAVAGALPPPGGELTDARARGARWRLGRAGAGRSRRRSRCAGAGAPAGADTARDPRSARAACARRHERRSGRAPGPAADRAGDRRGRRGGRSAGEQPRRARDRDGGEPDRRPRDRARGRRPARLPRGQPRVADPLARSCPHRGAVRASPRRRGRCGAAGCPRCRPTGKRRSPRRCGARRGLALRPPRRRRRLRRAAARRPPPDRDRARPAGLAAGARRGWPWSSPRARPLGC